MVLPQALAIEINAAGPSGSSRTSFSSTEGNTVSLNTQANGQSSQTTGSLKLTDSGVGGQVYNDWYSSDGMSTAVSYAYFDTNVLYTYTAGGSSGPKTATATINVYAKALPLSLTNANDFLFGGFAENNVDYAGTFVSGRLNDDLAPITKPGTINYQNSLYASPSKVSAASTFYGNNLEGLESATWAERGNIANEARTKTETDLMWADVLANVGFRFPYLAPVTWQDSNIIYSGQYMQDRITGNDVTIKSSTPYKSSASLTSNTATSSQAVTLSTDSTVYLESFALNGDGATIGSSALTSLSADGTGGVATVTYSGSSKATTAQATASQSVGATARNDIVKTATSVVYGEDLDSTLGLTLSNGASALTKTSFTGTDSVTSKPGTSSITSKITSSLAADIGKVYFANNNPLDYHIGGVNIITSAPLSTAASTLSGQSTLSSTQKSVSVASSGNYKAAVGVGSTYFRSSNVNNPNGGTVFTDPKAAQLTKKYYTYLEKSSATATSLTAV